MIRQIPSVWWIRPNLYVSVVISLANKMSAYIDGKWVSAVSGQTFDVSNPATGATLATVANCGAKDVQLAIGEGRFPFVTLTHIWYKWLQWNYGNSAKCFKYCDNHATSNHYNCSLLLLYYFRKHLLFWTIHYKYYTVIHHLTWISISIIYLKIKFSWNICIHKTRNKLYYIII